jgi:hypothetical protein
LRLPRHSNVMGTKQLKLAWLDGKSPRKVTAIPEAVHPTFEFRAGPSTLPIRPTTILLKSAGAVLASVVQESRTYVLPHGVRAIQPQGVGLLNFNDAKAAQAFDAKQVPGDFGYAPESQFERGVDALLLALGADPRVA